MPLRRVDELVIGDLIDLEGDQYADPGGQRTMMRLDFAEVRGWSRGADGGIYVDSSIGSFVFPPGHVVDVVHEADRIFDLQEEPPAPRDGWPTLAVVTSPPDLDGLAEDLENLEIHEHGRPTLVDARSLTQTLMITLDDIVPPGLVSSGARRRMRAAMMDLATEYLRIVTSEDGVQHRESPVMKVPTGRRNLQLEG